MSPTVAVLFHRIGPYHFARLVAVGARCALTAVELSAVDDTYAWSQVKRAPNFTRLTLFEEDADRRSGTEVRRSVRRALAMADPEIVAVPGWSHPAAFAALLWCLRNGGRRAVLMSESGIQDDVRRRAGEAIKRRVVRLFSSAVVGGAPQAAYARELGIPEEAIFPGYDAVDNAYFAEQAARVRDMAEVERARLDLPVRFFLGASRFVAKKNLFGLLEAYAAYRQRTGAGAWHLVLLGDGALRAQIESRIVRLDLIGRVMLPGFKQYEELPAW
jgi:1,2-diacylglycerol 3-alpha-glucosyltransferase